MFDNEREGAAARANGFSGDRSGVAEALGRGDASGYVRPARASDLPRIHAVHAAAFPTTAEADLVDALITGDHAAASLVVIADACVVGHALQSRARVVDADGVPRAVLALAPVAVLPAYQGRGHGGRLVGASLDAAREIGASAVIVAGHPDYYPRFGFEQALPLGIEPPFEDVPAEAWMVAETTPGGLAGMRGVVRYAPPFDALAE